MAFYYPAFLAAISVLAIPIIIHLFNIRRFRKVAFTNVAFLEEIIHRKQKRKSLKHFLVLAARCLALLFLVLAFAKPFIETQAKTGKKAVSIYLDNSFSMQGNGSEGLLFESAKNKAREIVKSMIQQAEFQLLTNDLEGRMMKFSTGTETLLYIDELKLSSTHLSAAKALQLQQKSLLENPAPTKLIFHISDFRENNLQSYNLLKADSLISTSFIPLRGNEIANLTIDSVWMQSPFMQSNTNNSLMARVVNYGKEAIENKALKLEINGKTQAIANLNLKPEGTEVIELSFTPESGGSCRAIISLPPDEIGFDDKFFITFNSVQHIPVLLINETESTNYAEKVLRSNSLVQLTTVSAAQANTTNLKGMKMVVFNGVKSISSDLSDALSNYLNEGNLAVVIPSANSTAYLSGIGAFCKKTGLSVPDKLIEQQINVAIPDVSNPFFKDMFSELPKNMETPLVKKYYSGNLSARPATPLLKLQNGDALLTGYTFETGKLLVFNVPMDDLFTNFQRSAFFPLIFSGAAVSHYAPGQIYATNGDKFPYRMQMLLRNPNENYKLKSTVDSLEYLPEIQNLSNSSLLYGLDQIKLAGLYTLQDKNNTTFDYLAFNFDRAESDTRNASEEKLAALAKTLNATILSSTGENFAKEILNGQGFPIWKWFILLALVFLAAEMMMLKWL